MTTPSDRDQAALAAWLDSQRTSSNAQNEDSLLRSLDEASAEITAGRGVPIEEVRKRVAAWAGK